MLHFERSNWIFCAIEENFKSNFCNFVWKFLDQRASTTRASRQQTYRIRRFEQLPRFFGSSYFERKSDQDGNFIIFEEEVKWYRFFKWKKSINIYFWKKTVKSIFSVFKKSIIIDFCRFPRLFGNRSLHWLLWTSPKIHFSVIANWSHSSKLPPPPKISTFCIRFNFSLVKIISD